MSKQMLELAERLTKARIVGREPQLLISVSDAERDLIVEALRCSAESVTPQEMLLAIDDGFTVSTPQAAVYDACVTLLEEFNVTRKSSTEPQIAFTIDETTATEIAKIDASLPASERLKKAVSIARAQPQSAPDNWECSCHGDPNCPNPCGRSQAVNEHGCAHELVGFVAIWAVQFAKDHGLDGLHPTHYDLLKKYGARMDDLKRASLTRPERGEP